MDNQANNEPGIAASSPAPQQRQQGKKKPYLSRPQNKTGKAPQRKSNSEITLTNDPLWKESFIMDGETGFLSTNAAKEFNADAAGYTYLIDQEYKVISNIDVNKNYWKFVPSSAHAYYHNILWWYKIALIAQKRGNASPDQHSLVHFVSGYRSAVIAAGAGLYLEGLGDYQDATGVIKHLLKAKEPNANGHFGRATAHTHGLYETLPAPAIFYRRMVEDLIASQRDVDPDVNWMLQDITPENAHQRQESPSDPEVRVRAIRGAVREQQKTGSSREREEDNHVRPQPTVNLLGWRKPVSLNADQLLWMSNLIDIDDPMTGLVNAKYCIQREVFEFVGGSLRECIGYKMSPIPNTTGGSVVQQVTWKPVDYKQSRFQMAIETDGCAISRTNLPLRLVSAAKIMFYRTLRLEFEDNEGNPVHKWSCYDFNQNPPDNWIANRNTLIYQGNDGLIDDASFTTPITARTDTVLNFLTKFKSY